MTSPVVSVLFRAIDMVRTDESLDPRERAIVARHCEDAIARVVASRATKGFLVLPPEYTDIRPAMPIPYNLTLTTSGRTRTDTENVAQAMAPSERDTLPDVNARTKEASK